LFQTQAEKGIKVKDLKEITRAIKLDQIQKGIEEHHQVLLQVQLQRGETRKSIKFFQFLIL